MRVVGGKRSLTALSDDLQHGRRSVGPPGRLALQFQGVGAVTRIVAHPDADPGIVLLQLPLPATARTTGKV